MICKNCIHSEVCKDYSIYKDTIIACEKYKDGTIKNQYDRIRNMSVVEFAEFMAAQVMQQEQKHLIEKNPNITATHIEFLKHTLFRGYLRYLESEVRE